MTIRFLGTKACALALGSFLTFGGSALALDPWADEVASDNINNASCGGDCYGSAAGTLGEPDFPISNNPDHLASLGVAGSVTLNFTNNTCILNESGEDLFVNEVVLDEHYTVQIGQTGVGLNPTTFPGLGAQLFDVSSAGLVGYNQVRITDADTDDVTPEEEPAAFGADIDAVACNSIPFGTAHIIKGIVGNSTIEVGVDYEQQFVFAILITNPEGVDLTGLAFRDVVPAEFDVLLALVAEENGGADCEVTGVGEITKTNGNGNQKLAPDFIDFTADIPAGGSCVIAVQVATDDDHPGGGNSPDYTPTSCDGSIVLNDGVQVSMADGSGLLFIDDDSLELGCVLPE